jgi:hypothetical protein
MEPQPAPAAAGVLARIRSQLDWYWTLSPPGRAAFWATFSGWALDAYNQMTLGFILPALTAAFAVLWRRPRCAGRLVEINFVPATVLSSNDGVRHWGFAWRQSRFALSASLVPLGLGSSHIIRTRLAKLILDEF